MAQTEVCLMPQYQLKLRRHAVEIVSQLPESLTDARTVLNLARELLDGFLSAQDASGGRIPNLRAISNDSPLSSPSNIQSADSPLIWRAKD